MKLIEPHVIETAEKKMINTIADNIRWKSVRDAIRKELNIALMKDLTIADGKLIVRDNEIIFQIMLGPHTGVSVFFDQAGELVEIDYTDNRESVKEILAKPDEEVIEEQAAAETAIRLSAEISRLIVRINTRGGKNSPKDEE